jgi:hypothetical protein
LLTAAFSLAALPAGSQVEIQRSFDAGSWKVYVRRDLWNDQIDALAQTNYVAISPGTGYAGINMHCGEQRPIIEFSWPRRLTSSGGERAVMYVRIGRDAPVSVWLSVAENTTSFLGSVDRRISAIDEDKFLQADEVTFGPDIGGPAARVRTSGAREAWRAIREACERRQ